MHKLFLTIAVLLTLLITIGSLVPVNNVVQIKVSNSDKIIHLAAYFLLALNWLFAFKKQLNNTKKVLFVVAGVIFYGIIIEVFQGALTTNRQADYFDVVANSLGVFSAMFVFKKYFFKK